MKIELININDIKGYERNNKIHTDEQIEQIARSIRKFGFTNPVLIDENNVLIAGHGRVEGARYEGMVEVPAIRIEDMTEDQKKRYRLVDNRLTELGEWDKANIKIELMELGIEELSDLFIPVLGDFGEIELDDDGFDMDDEIDGYSQLMGGEEIESTKFIQVVIDPKRYVEIVEKAQKFMEKEEIDTISQAIHKMVMEF